MATVRWPDSVLSPRGISVDIAPRSLSGPASISGAVQVVASDAGIWKVTFEGIPVVNEQKVKAWRGVAGLLEGRLNPIVLPISRFYQPGWVENDNSLVEPVPHSDDAFFSDGSGYVGATFNAYLAGSVAARAVSASLTVDYGVDIEPGQHFSLGERLYRVRTVTETAPGTPAGTVMADADFSGSSWTAVTPTFTRASSATYFDANGVMQTAANNVPRFDHDPVTGAARGLLREEQRTNLFLWSEAFDNAAWVKALATVTAGATVAPTGSLVAQKMVETASAGLHSISRSQPFISGQVYTFSIFFRPAERSIVELSLGNAAFGGGNLRIEYNLATGGAAQIASGGTDLNFGMQDVGNGWYRCFFTAKAIASASTFARWQLSQGAGVVSYSGDGTSGLYVWGAQMEVSGDPTSYIPTTTASATRAADLISVATSGLIGESGTILACVRTNNRSYAGIWQIDDGTNDNRLRAIGWNASGTIRAASIVSGSEIQQVIGAFARGVPHRIAVAFGKNAISASMDGSATLTSATPIPTGLTTLRVGAASANNAFGLGGTIERFVVIPDDLSDEELQRISNPATPDIFGTATSLSNLFYVANAETPIASGNVNDWLVTLSDGTTLEYAGVVGDLDVPAEDIGYRTISRYRKTLAKPLPATVAVTFRPPAREAVSIGTRAEFDDPVVRVKLATDNELDLGLDYNRFGFPSVNFVEDV